MNLPDSTTATQERIAEDAPGFLAILRPRELRQRLEAEYQIDQFPLTVGRHESNDIELPFDSVSRFHARIEIHEGALRIVDLQSSNGTSVNGKRVRIAPLQNQDLIAFGSVEMNFVALETPAGQRITAPPPEGATVHFLTEDREVLQSTLEADLPEDTSSIPDLGGDITDQEELHQAREKLMTFYRLQEVLRSTTDEKKLLRRVLSLLFQVLPVDRGVALTRDVHDSQLFKPVAIQIRPGETSARSIGISKTILARSLKDKVAILTRDASLDDRFSESESIRIHGIRSAMCVPLLSQHHVFGFIHLDTSNSIRAFAKDDLEFLANVAHEVATYLHNIRMLQEKIVSERMAAIGQTITGLAHNIKNVLLLSEGGVELMEKGLEKKNYESIGETWSLVKRGIDRINSMAKAMLDYARARVVEKSRCQINELLGDICASFAEQLEKHSVRCDLDLDEKCPPVMLDVDGLEKAVVNLLLNALEACAPTEGHVTLRTRFNEEEGSLVIAVEDNGGGIPKEVERRIFVPFFTTKGTQGNGLGLAMTKKFVEEMGGRIDVKSVPGEGSVFTITIFVDQSDIRLDSSSPDLPIGPSENAPDSSPERTSPE